MGEQDQAQQHFSEPTDLTCLADVPEIARRSLWQQRIAQNYGAIAITPFVLLLCIDFKFFGDSINPIWAYLGELTLIWAMGIAVYTFYVSFWGVKCPKCGHGFGIKDACRSCGLPRYEPTTTDSTVKKKLHFWD